MAGRIGIIDYGMGNLRSVQKALQSVGADAVVLTDPTDQVDRLILPGVGAFADGMANLTARGWVEPIRRFIDSGRPFLGICLGLQLLFDGSQEDAVGGHPVPGLGLLPGQVVQFVPQNVQGKPRLKVPHMGWNAVSWQRSDPLLAGLTSGVGVYFVHGYYALPGDDSVISSTCDYGIKFCASIWRKNIWATQFHPEKSQAVGLQMLANFSSMK